jgi:hypothetical protein
MVTFDEFVRRFSGLKAFVEKKAQEIIMSRGEEIVQMVRDQHLKGVNIHGKKMQTGYSPGYSRRRRKKGLQVRYVDLHFTGKMHRGLKVIPVKEGVDVRSEEPYEWYVRANFPESFGLTRENANDVSEALANLLAPEIKKYLVA